MPESPAKLRAGPFIVDVVAVEHGTRLVPRDAPGNRFRYSSPHHIAHSGPAEIVEDPALVLELLASPLLCA
jgi:hypothetical protein